MKIDLIAPYKRSFENFSIACAKGLSLQQRITKIILAIFELIPIFNCFVLQYDLRTRAREIGDTHFKISHHIPAATNTELNPRLTPSTEIQSSMELPIRSQTDASTPPKNPLVNLPNSSQEELPLDLQMWTEDHPIPRPNPRQEEEHSLDLQMWTEDSQKLHKQSEELSSLETEIAADKARLMHDIDKLAQLVRKINNPQLNRQMGDVYNKTLEFTKAHPST